MRLALPLRIALFSSEVSFARFIAARGFFLNLASLLGSAESSDMKRIRRVMTRRLQFAASPRPFLAFSDVEFRNRVLVQLLARGQTPPVDTTGLSLAKALIPRLRCGKIADQPKSWIRSSPFSMRRTRK
jgi:hypothetical protein